MQGMIACLCLGDSAKQFYLPGLLLPQAPLHCKDSLFSLFPLHSGSEMPLLLIRPIQALLEHEDAERQSTARV